MGLEAVFGRCNPVFVSAAGAPFSKTPMAWTDTHTEIGVALRATSILTEQTRALRRRLLLRRYINDHIGGCYWNIASTIARYDLSDPMIEDSELTHSLQFVRTRLNRFDPREQGHPINWGYAIADTSIRKWVMHQPPGEWSWPSPDYPL